MCLFMARTIKKISENTQHLYSILSIIRLCTSPSRNLPTKQVHPSIQKTNSSNLYPKLIKGTTSSEKSKSLTLKNQWPQDLKPAR
ncbi:hypothetical protein GUJ93_ZPchr0012g19773 [Zizania palustris]|uniref:Uncharacterized protein n=1 Tax=Zizania palustris TaxID=103762 RepID=A0A8J6BRX7_ZIZPA|nr:hypothetical protein GUJ93_ZPchr0012g19773 [Zizania palustris]